MLSVWDINIGSAANKGGLDGGGPNFREKFKKWVCRLSLLLWFGNVPCQI